MSETATTKQNDLIMSFDGAMDHFENDGDKAEKRELARMAKLDQMDQKIRKMRSDIAKQKQKLKKSLIDSNADTIQIQLDLSVMEKEYEVASGLFKVLFPTEAAV